MKTTIRKQIGLAALLMVGCLGFGPLTASAQDDAASAAQHEATSAAAMSEKSEALVAAEASEAMAAEARAEANAKKQQRDDFRDSFDKLGQGQRRNAVVTFGKSADLKTNQTADAVVAIGGSAIAHGNVRDAVVAIGGDVTIDGAEVGDAVVAVLGNIKVLPGSVVHGAAVAVGGKVEVAEGAKVEGEIQEIDFGAFGLPSLDWLKQWLVQCVFKLRPLALGPGLGWLWMVAGAFFFFYLLVAVAFPRPVEICLAEITRRPATTFLIGLLTLILFPLIFLLLAATGIGVVVFPFLVAALFFGALIGKVAFLEYLGQSLGRAFGMTPLIKPVVAFLIGSLILTLVYLVPILGLITLALTALWGLGVAITAAFGSFRRELPERPTTPPPPAPMPGQAWPTTVGSTAAFAAGTPPATAPEYGVPPASGRAEAGLPPTPMAVPMSPSATPSEVLSFPRASFWERLGAAFLDVIIVSILGTLVGGPPQGFLVALAYFAGMWAWKGTTVGGVVLNLKVVRLDDRPVTFAVALVRGLASVLSVIVLFLGFLWMIWDRDKQTWHDKIAGTVVIRLPRGMPLVCL
ncbi:MAG: RDD family protein [Verrucomicrobiota bacterium]